MDLRSLYDLVDAKPFRPFQLDLVNGRKIRVDHPENLNFFPGRERLRIILVYYPDPDDSTIIFPEAIAAIHLGSAGNGNGGTP